ncbi:hypothetical protein F5Y09DRAFT_294347 [Xylaria sp. FL1042]|nr:hypothetical protein F5Y09DRAFT_294347 [Xylaria sp. FL1042]
MQRIRIHLRIHGTYSYTSAIYCLFQCIIRVLYYNDHNCVHASWPLDWLYNPLYCLHFSLYPSPLPPIWLTYMHRNQHTSRVRLAESWQATRIGGRGRLARLECAPIVRFLKFQASTRLPRSCRADWPPLFGASHRSPRRACGLLPVTGMYVFFYEV